jgi:hypothetical protein
MADTQPVLQRLHVALPIPQLLDDTDAVRVRKNSKECGKLLRDQKSVRHGALPSCSNLQMLEYNVMAEHTVGKSRASDGCGDLPKQSGGNRGYLATCILREAGFDAVNVGGGYKTYTLFQPSKT